MSSESEDRPNFDLDIRHRYTLETLSDRRSYLSLDLIFFNKVKASTQYGS